MKKILGGLAIASLIGAGTLLASLPAGKSVETKAAVSYGYLYVDVSNVSWWEGDEAKTYACFTDEIKSNVKDSNLGNEMIAIPGRDHIYGIEVTTKTKYVYFNRISSDGTVIWNTTGGTTKPLEVPDLIDFNIWTVNSDSTGLEVVEGNASAGYWSYENPALENGFYIKGENGFVNGIALGWGNSNHIPFGEIPLEITEGAVLKCQYYSNGKPGNWAGVNGIASSDSTYYPMDYQKNSNNVEIQKAGVYGLNLVWTHDDNNGAPYYRYEFSNSATDWANKFLNSMNCDGGVSPMTFKGEADFASWGDCSDAYDDLDDYAKNVFYAAASNEDGTKIEEAVKRHEVLTKKGYLSFIKNASGTSRAAAVSSNEQVLGTNSSSNPLIITLACAGAVALAGIGLVVIHKKENN